MLPSVKSLDLFRKSDSKRKDVNHLEEDASVNLISADSETKRQRTFASERNQFVVHVYISLEGNEQVQDIYDEFSDISPKVVFHAEPHISLIRGHYAVQYHQIDPLLNQLSAVIESTERFSLCLSNVQLFSNDEKSRHFIAICEAKQVTDISVDQTNSVTKLSRSHHQLIQSIHTILQQYRSEIYTIDKEKIDNFTYHTSIAWFLPENYEIGNRICDEVRDHFAEHVILSRVNQVCIKIGHRTKVVQLL